MPDVFAGVISQIARATCIFVAFATYGVGYAAPNPAMNEKDLASNSSSPLPKPKKIAALSEKLRWSELSPVQQQALAPLANEWDQLERGQKRKWLVISSKYPSLGPDQQIRIQDRMRDWVKLTPEQRRVARESYSRTKKLDPDQKAAEWQQYQQLSEEQKKKLSDDAATKKRITNLPPASQTRGKVTPPPKQSRDINPKDLPDSSPINEATEQSAHQPPLK